MVYKVTFHLDGKGVVFNRREPLHLDGLLAYYVFMEKYHEIFKQPINRDDPIIEVDLPLEKVILSGEEVWKASAILPVGDIVHEKRYYRKNFPQKRADGLTNGNITITTGHYRSYNNSLQLYLCSKMEAYFDGDYDEVSRLLNKVKRIGQKRSHGHGNVTMISYEESKYDYTILNNDKINRYFPHEEGIRMIRPRPPYWANEGKVPCFPIGWRMEEA